MNIGLETKNGKVNVTLSNGIRVQFNNDGESSFIEIFSRRGNLPDARIYYTCDGEIQGITIRDNPSQK